MDALATSHDHDWSLGPAARLLTQPLSDLAQRVLGRRDLEAKFLASAWARQHALLAVLDHIADARGSAPDDQLRDLGSEFATFAPGVLIERWYGRRAPGVARVFEKLGGARPRERGLYTKLVAIISHDGLGAKTLRHVSNLTFRDVRRLAPLPDWLRIEEMRWWEPHLSRQLAAIGDAILARGDLSSAEDFRRLVTSQGFAVDPLDALLGCDLVFSFPEPPWEGNERLRPIRDTRELAAAATQFRNCLRRSATDCLSGQRHFYVWQARDPAVVEVRNLAGLCWQVHAIAGVGNTTLSADEEEAIREELRLDAINETLWRRATKQRSYA